MKCKINFCELFGMFLIKFKTFSVLLVFVVILHNALGQRRYNPCNDVPGGTGELFEEKTRSF
jgi:hypothetical protein